MSKYPLHCIQSNSLEHFRNLASAKTEQMTAANRCQFDHLKEVQKQESTTSKFEPKGTKSVLGKLSHLENERQGEGEQEEAFNDAEHEHDANQATRASKRQRTTTQQGRKIDAEARGRVSVTARGDQAQAGTRDNAYNPFTSHNPTVSRATRQFLGSGEPTYTTDRSFKSSIYSTKTTGAELGIGNSPGQIQLRSATKSYTF